MVHLTGEEQKAVMSVISKLCIKHAEMEIQRTDYVDRLMVLDAIIGLNLLLPKELQNGNLHRRNLSNNKKDAKE